MYSANIIRLKMSVKAATYALTIGIHTSVVANTIADLQARHLFTASHALIPSEKRAQPCALIPRGLAQSELWLLSFAHALRSSFSALQVDFETQYSHQRGPVATAKHSRFAMSVALIGLTSGSIRLHTLSFAHGSPHHKLIGPQ